MATHWRGANGVYLFDDRTDPHGPPHLTMSKDEQAEIAVQHLTHKFWDPFGANASIGARQSDVELIMTPWTASNVFTRDIGGDVPDY